MTNNLTESSNTKLSNKDFAYYQIKKRIIEGKLTPNLSLIEKDLSEKLNISRTPLREALQRLEYERLVVKKKNGRLKTAPISVQEAKEIFTVRARLEAIAVGEATENVTDKDIENLANIIRMMEKTYDEGKVEDILHYGLKFHTYIYELSGNKTVTTILDQLKDHTQRYRRLVPEQTIDKVREAEEGHQKILKYIVNKDVKGGELAMQEHIENSLSSAINAIEEYEKNNEDLIWS